MHVRVLIERRMKYRKRKKERKKGKKKMKAGEKGDTTQLLSPISLEEEKQ